MDITLYRGITVKPEDASTVKSHILSKGLTNEQGRMWRFECVDLRPRVQQLFEKSDLTTEDTRPSRWIKTSQGGHSEPIGGFPAICACADILGASYYAIKHNYNSSAGLIHGLIITLRANIADIQVDGRDFLYNSVFRDARVPEQRNLACRMFGTRLGLYLDHAMANTNISYKFAMCDLAIQDEEVVKAHAKNDIIIGGRYGTVFRSAFFVKVPVLAKDIISVNDAQHLNFAPELTIGSFRRMGDNNI